MAENDDARFARSDHVGVFKRVRPHVVRDGSRLGGGNRQRRSHSVRLVADAGWR